MCFQTLLPQLQSGPPYICPQCRQPFKLMPYLRDHLRGVHGMGRPFDCSCGQVFSSRTTRNRHRRCCQIDKSLQDQ